MDPTHHSLLARLDQLSDQFRELKDGVHKAIRIADEDPEMALTRSRKVLEYVVRDVYERRIKEPPGTRPLENLLQRLVKDGQVPDRLDAYATTVRKLGNVGTHSFGEKVTAADVYQSLTQLMPILEWYFEVERPAALDKGPVAQGPVPKPKAEPASEPAQILMAVVPKGLRSFDANDAEFFLQLLPGPRDKNGLPESLRFWKHRIEETDEPSFSVGVMYGPSGCGKSSLVKAGLLPRLSDDVIAVYVEATAEETEARLLNGLRKRCLALPDNLSLKSTLAALRGNPVSDTNPRNPVSSRNRVSDTHKVLIVLDQFEQWLHAKRMEENTELVQALRQCDGEHVQCLVLVRDDFWLALSRFMSDLHIELLQGQNIALVDLFDLRHARNVLLAYGKAFATLPKDLSEDHDAFLDQAIAGLAQDGRVISIRLAVFAEMVKAKPWTRTTLKEIGGMEGVGVSFLEETLGSRTANSRLRLHEQAARAVLKVLLPESGSDIKGHMRSRQELLEASGCANRQKEFDDLMRILDGELRLITPTDTQESAPPEAHGRPSVGLGLQCYQLTHDYLVPSLREWLTRKQKETRRGRAELLLADRAAVWNARPENRQLPSALQWFRIKLLTQKKNWTSPERKMMAKAGKYHALRGVVAAVLLAVATFAGLTIREQVLEQRRATHAAGLVQSLLNADTARIPALVGEMSEYRQWVDAPLKEAFDRAAGNPRQQLHASLALLPVDATQVAYLYDRLLEAAPHEVPVIRDALAPHKDALLDKLWTVTESPAKGKESQRLRAASALAKYDPESERWGKVGAFVVEDLVLQNPVYLGQWSEAFRPAKKWLLIPLAVIFRDRNAERASERTLATNLLAGYAADQPRILADLLMDADERQFAVIYPMFKEQGERGLPVLTNEMNKKLPSDLPSSDGKREALAKRQANAAVALLRMNHPEKVWPLLKHSPDPRVRSYVIHKLSPLGADPAAILKRLDEEPDLSIRRALLLSLGEYGEKKLPPDALDGLLPKLQEIYRTAPDPGLHAAAEWLLRQWKQEAWLKQVNDQWAKDREERAKRLEGIRQGLQMASRAAAGSETRFLQETGFLNPASQWYVNSQGQTLVVIPGPVEFLMGSPTTEADRREDESQHRVRIARSFALAAAPVTKEQFLRFRPTFRHSEFRRYPEDSCPIGGVNWYEAAEYCNWLSAQEGLLESEWCYDPVVDRKAMPALAASTLGIIVGEPHGGGALSAACGAFPGRTEPSYTAGMRLAANYLGRTGYRLPTEAEMEYATRAGALTSRYYGETEELLPKYAWYRMNSQEKTWPVGSLKPNDLGVFDAQGNVFTWCQEGYKSYVDGEEVSEDREDNPVIVSTRSRVLRGSSFVYLPSNDRSAFRNANVPASRIRINGFRLARTLVRVPATALQPSPERGR